MELSAADRTLAEKVKLSKLKEFVKENRLKIGTMEYSETDGVSAFCPDSLDSFRYLDDNSLEQYINWALWWGSGDRIQAEIEKIEQFTNLPTELLASFMVSAMNRVYSRDSFCYAKHYVPPELKPFGTESSCYSYSVSFAEVAKLKRREAEEYRKRMTQVDNERGEYLALALFLEELKEQEREEALICRGLINGYDFHQGDIVLTFEWNYVPRRCRVTIGKISDNKNRFGVPILEAVTKETEDLLKEIFQEIWVESGFCRRIRDDDVVMQCLHGHMKDEKQTRLRGIAKYDVLKYYAEHPEYIAAHRNLIICNSAYLNCLWLVEKCFQIF